MSTSAADGDAAGTLDAKEFLLCQPISPTSALSSSFVTTVDEINEPHYSHYYYHRSSMSSVSSEVRQLNVLAMADVTTAVPISLTRSHGDFPDPSSEPPGSVGWRTIGHSPRRGGTNRTGPAGVEQLRKREKQENRGGITEVGSDPIGVFHQSNGDGVENAEEAAAASGLPRRRRPASYAIGMMCRNCFSCVGCGTENVDDGVYRREEEELRSIIEDGRGSEPFRQTRVEYKDGSRTEEMQDTLVGETYNGGNGELVSSPSQGVVRRRRPDPSQEFASGLVQPSLRGPDHLIHEYIDECNRYDVRTNPGVLTSFRFRLPTIRPDGSFHDADMLALVEVLLRHCNDTSAGGLSHIVRLDFGLASKYGRDIRIVGSKKHRGFRSHGALTLSKVLLISKHIREVYLQRHRIGPYGGTALAIACSKNKSLRVLSLRRCGIRERGARAFVDYIALSPDTGLHEVDLSANGVGFRGVSSLLLSLEARQRKNLHAIEFDLEGNLVFQEVMNSVTHGLGILLIIIGTILLSARTSEMSFRHRASCAVYSASLLVLYTSSTLYHSFFTMRLTKDIFDVLDHCSIYVLIAGSYTPYLTIVFPHKPAWSVYLLAFIWICCFAGLMVEAFGRKWKHKSKFSLSMYIGMGWAALLCFKDMLEELPVACLYLLVAGGVSYTGGVPWFVRNNNMDHAIWHCFVLAGSIFHWYSIFSYVVPLP